MGTLELKLSDRKYKKKILGTGYLANLNMMSIVLLLCVTCSIALPTGNLHEDIDLSKDSMIAPLTTSQHVDNHETNLDADSGLSMRFFGRQGPAYILGYTKERCEDRGCEWWPQRKVCF